MIEQLASMGATQGSNFLEQQANQSQINDKDVMRFNMEMAQGKDTADNTDLLEMRTESQDSILKIESGDSVANPLMKMDSSFKDIMSQMSQVPEFDKFLDHKDIESTKKFHSNVEQPAIDRDPNQEMKDMIQETRELYKEAGGFSKDVSKWHIKTQIWSANIKVLTSMVSQASQGIKTLFRSAG